MKGEAAVHENRRAQKWNTYQYSSYCDQILKLFKSDGEGGQGGTIIAYFYLSSVDLFQRCTSGHPHTEPPPSYY